MSLQGLLRGPGVVAVLGQEVSVRLTEISRSGCLLECSHPMPSGTVALLSLDIDGRPYRDGVRVSRSQRVPGGGERYEVGVEFLWLHPPLEGSLRQYAALLTSSWPDLRSNVG
jgi:hypothetical protein